MNRLAIGLLIALLGCERSGKTPAPPPALEPAPELNGALTWLNSPAVRLGNLRGKVVVLHFFNYADAASLGELAWLQDCRQRYGADLVLLGIHVPEYDFTLDPINVSAGVKRLGLTYPVAVDAGFKIAATYHNEAVPRVVVVDQAGQLRLAGAAGELEPVLRGLLPKAPAAAPVTLPASQRWVLGRVGAALGNEPVGGRYTLPAEMAEERVYVAGQWSRAEGYLRHTADVPELTDAVVLRFRGRGAAAVMKPEDVYWKQVLVQVDGQWLGRGVAGKDVSFDEVGRSFVKVNQAAHYELATGLGPGWHELRLFAEGKGLSVYALSVTR